MPAQNKIPQHIAIIMDGNGRWAKEKGLPRVFGHREGVKRVREIISAAHKLGVKVLTLFAFSAENWNRPKKEVDILMRYLNNFLDYEINRLHKSNIRLLVIGRSDPLSRYLQKKIKEAEDKTKDNTGLTVVLALNYGGRQEILDAVKKIVDAVLRSEIKIEDLDEELFSRYFYHASLPDPEFLIRTSGEMRISNFLLWQLSYTELYFSKKYWPDFHDEDFQEAIKDYQKRERRFGRLNLDVIKENN